MKIGNLTLQGHAALAPMAGVADRAFRETCIGFGAGYVVSEMASAKGMLMGGRKTGELLAVTQGERPMAVQLFGESPAVLAQAARRAMAFAPDVIDINMGCPAPKVAGNGGGSALMRTPKLCGDIVRAVADAVEVPVTAKIRKGWDDALVTAVEVARQVEKAGASAVTVHGRTRQQMYAPPVDLDIIRAVKQAVSIPVIGNGDIYTARDAAHMLEYTGCDYLMVGRGALGNPWIFSQLNAYLEQGILMEPPGVFERMRVMLTHVERICLYKGEAHGIKEARKHVGWYLHGLKGAASFRKRAGELCSMDELKALALEVIAANENREENEKDGGNHGLD